MRILIVSIYYRPEPIPKPHELAEGLAARGHTVEVVTGFPQYPYGRFYDGYKLRPWRIERINGVRVVRLAGFPDHSVKPILRILNIITFFVSSLFGGWFLPEEKPDVIYVWGNPPTSGLVGLILSKLWGAKLVYGIHDLWPELAIETGMLKPGFLTRSIGALEDFVVRHSDHSISISHGFARALVARGADSDRMTVIPHWADETLYKPVERDDAIARELGAEGRFVVLYAGNIGRMQGLEHLIEAAKILRDHAPETLVILVGDGVERQRLKEMAAEESPDNVRFVDPQTPERIVAFSAIADVLYVALVAGPLARLSVPSKVATYMATGRSLLSAVPGETSDLVTRAQCGVTCELDAASIVAGLLQLRDAGAAERERMGKNAHVAFLSELSRERLLDQHQELMSSLLLSPNGIVGITQASGRP